MHYGQSASDRASHAEEAPRPCKYRAKEKKRRGCRLNIFKDCPRVANDFIPPPLSPGGCVKTTKQTRRHFDRREKSSLQRAKSDFEISRCARNDKNDMKMVLFTQPVWVGGYRGKAAKPSPRCPIDKELSVNAYFPYCVLIYVWPCANVSGDAVK